MTINSAKQELVGDKQSWVTKDKSEYEPQS